MKKILLIALLGCFVSAHSQKDYSVVYDADAFIKKGIAFYEEKKYAEALKEFDRVDRLDPLYMTAQYERVLTLTAAEKKEEARAIFEDLYKNNQMAKEPNLFVLYGSFLSDEKNYAEAEKIFNEGKKLTPHSTSLLYNMAILYIRMEERQKSVDILKQIITFNPNSASSHYLLGSMALEEGKIVEGTLALLSYLAIAPKGSRAADAILKLNAKFGENYLEKGKLVFSASGDNYEEIETILRNQLPLKKAYKINSVIDDVLIRQIQAVADYTLEHKMENGFFEQTYIPWIKDLMQRKEFEGLSYYILLVLEDTLGKQYTSQKKKITEFYNGYYQNHFWDNFAKRKIMHFGKEQEVIVYLENGQPYLVGSVVNGKKEGKFRLLNEFGNTIGELNTRNDQLDGLQKYYNNDGVLTTEKNFTDGKANGKRTAYFSNGQVSAVENYKDDELEGTTTTYYVNGGKQCEMNFKNGKRDGKFTCLYPNGSKKYEIDYTDGEINGKYLSYNRLGDITESATYIKGEIDGKTVAYYDGKAIKSEATYSNGKAQGSVKKYYSDGKLEEEIVYQNGKMVKSFAYRPSGKKDTESVYDDKGELELFTLFDKNGEKYFDEKFKSGELKSGLQYSKTNPKPVEINLTKKAFAINSLNDKTEIAGNFEKGRKAGEWKYFYTSGNLKSKSNFSQGKLEGLFQTYDRNSLIASTSHYANDTISGLKEVFSRGRLDKEFHYAKGLAEGPYRAFHPDGSVKTHGYYAEDELNGDRITYWQNGVISKKEKFIGDVNVSVETYNPKGEKENSLEYTNKSGVVTQNYYGGTATHTFELKNGELNGKYTIKDKFNTPIFESEFTNGARNNMTRNYGPLGTVTYEMPFYNGVQHGPGKTYDLAGNLRLTDHYVFGDETGKVTRYYYNKSKMSEFDQVDTAIEGEYRYYNLKGELLLILGYVNNDVEYYIRRGKSGQIDEKVTVQNQTADIKSLYPNGKVAIAFQLVKGSKENAFAIYSAEGKPEYTAFYKNDLFEGERIHYYANGNIYKKERFAANDYEGLQEYFTEDGKPWLKANFKNDELHGDTLIYDKGVLAVTKTYNSDDLVAISK